MQKGLEIGSKTGQANALLKKGEYSEAECTFKEALTLIERDLADKSLDEDTAAVLKAEVLTKLGVLYTNEKDYVQAQAKFKDGLMLFEKTPDLPITPLKHMKDCLRAYAELLRVENKPDEASKLEERAAKIKA
jgi:tetratricopeptide (TPR) repeat protein